MMFHWIALIVLVILLFYAGVRFWVFDGLVKKMNKKIQDEYRTEEE